MTLEIFISSTCYDLRDMRAAISMFLKDLGIKPMLSDDGGFPNFHGLKPYVSCLKALEDCPMVVGVIDRKYGKQFSDWAPYPQYNNLSPIHAELRHALALKKRLLLYVQNDTMAVYEQWRKNSNKFDGIKFENGLSQETLLLIAEIKKHDPAPWIIEFEDVSTVLTSLKEQLINAIYQSLMEQKKESDDAAQYLLKKIFELSPEVRSKVESELNTGLVKSVGDLKTQLAELEERKKQDSATSEEMIAQINKEKKTLAEMIAAKEAEVAKSKMMLLLAATKDAAWLSFVRTRLMDKKPGRAPFHNDAEVAMRGFYCTNLRSTTPTLTSVTWKLIPAPKDGSYHALKAAVIFEGSGFAPGVVWAYRQKGSNAPASLWQQPVVYFGDYLEVCGTHDDPIEGPLIYRGTEFCARNPNGMTSEWVEFSYPFDLTALNRVVADSAALGKKLFGEGKYKDAVEPIRKAYTISDRINGSSNGLTKELYQLHETALDQRTLVGLRFKTGTKVRFVSGIHKGKQGVIGKIGTRWAMPYLIKDHAGSDLFAKDEDVEEIDGSSLDV